MWTSVMLAYAGGLLGTAYIVLKYQTAPQGNFVNTGVILLWPLYWTFFLTCIYLNRHRDR